MAVVTKGGTEGHVVGINDLAPNLVMIRCATLAAVVRTFTVPAPAMATRVLDAARAAAAILDTACACKKPAPPAETSATGS